MRIRGKKALSESERKERRHQRGKKDGWIELRSEDEEEYESEDVARLLINILIWWKLDQESIPSLAPREGKLSLDISVKLIRNRAALQEQREVTRESAKNLEQVSNDNSHVRLAEGCQTISSEQEMRVNRRDGGGILVDKQ